MFKTMVMTMIVVMIAMALGVTYVVRKLSMIYGKFINMFFNMTQML